MLEKSFKGVSRKFQEVSRKFEGRLRGVVVVVYYLREGFPKKTMKVWTYVQTVGR